MHSIKSETIFTINYPDKMKPLFFKKQADLRQWFEKNYLQLTEQWIGYYKKNSGKESITWSESVDEAICFGWIDGLRKSIDDESYMIRFTHRKPGSNWSAVNIKKVQKLTLLALMKPEGIEAYKKRKEKNSDIYSFEQKEQKLDTKYLNKIKSNKKAWTFFDKTLAKSYKKISIQWVLSAKREDTRIRRLNILIDSCAKGEKIPELMKYKK
jgi:uncharacterized protein YdeI (YjbR/CyaY-like superfamily)